jgi:prophage maintenance system killer protein
MNLLELAKHYNMIVRQSDSQHINIVDEPIEQFKNYQSNIALTNVLKVYQEKLDKNEKLSSDDIANLANDIVNSQHFVDGNHRTALLMCYHLHLFLNHQLLRIKPYLLYASIDFQYLKTQRDLDHAVLFFSNNAIKAAIISRTISDIHSTDLKLQHMQMIVELVKKMPKLLEKIATNICKPHDNSCTQQDRLFRAYAGFRMRNEHSSLVSIESYQRSIVRLKLDNEPFCPDTLIKPNLF